MNILFLSVLFICVKLERAGKFCLAEFTGNTSKNWSAEHRAVVKDLNNFNVGMDESELR